MLFLSHLRMKVSLYTFKTNTTGLLDPKSLTCLGVFSLGLTLLIILLTSWLAVTLQVYKSGLFSPQTKMQDFSIYAGSSWSQHCTSFLPITTTH